MSQKMTYKTNKTMSKPKTEPEYVKQEAIWSCDMEMNMAAGVVLLYTYTVQTQQVQAYRDITLAVLQACDLKLHEMQDVK